MAPKIVRRVERVVTQGTFVHFYLTCGHLITTPASDFLDKLPSEIECWACDEEHKKSVQSDKRFKERLH